MLGEMLCPHCHQKQWSSLDETYVKLFMTCWYCDKQRWEKGKMTLEIFESREKKAAEFNG